MGISRSQFIKLERGERRLTEHTIRLASLAFGVSAAAVIEQASVAMEPEPPSSAALVRVAGYVGTNGRVHLYDVPASELETVPAPPSATPHTLALEIRSKSLGELFDHWLLFYDDAREMVTPERMGRLCVVGLSDGRTLIRKLQRGKRAGLFRLLSENDPPMEDVSVQWATPVRALMPRTR